MVRSLAKLGSGVVLPTILISCTSISAPMEDFATKSLSLNLFDAAKVDLNGDGVPEHVLLARDQAFCGTGGCTLFVLTEAEGGIKQVGRIPAVKGPIRLSQQSNQGWRNLLFVARYDATRHYHGELLFEDGAYHKHVTDLRIDWDKPLEGDVLIER